MFYPQMYGCIVVGHRVHIVIHTADTLLTRLWYFTLSASFLFTLQTCMQDYKCNCTEVQGSKIKKKIVSRLYFALCMRKPGFAKLTVDYSEDQRSQRIALSAINNAFSVHSNHVQDTS